MFRSSRPKRKKVSYLISLVLTMLIVGFLPALPELGLTGLESIFSMIWLIFTSIVLIAHLRAGLSGQKEVGLDKRGMPVTEAKEALGKDDVDRYVKRRQ